MVRNWVGHKLQALAIDKISCWMAIRSFSEEGKTPDATPSLPSGGASIWYWIRFCHMDKMVPHVTKMFIEKTKYGWATLEREKLIEIHRGERMKKTGSSVESWLLLFRLICMIGQMPRIIFPLWSDSVSQQVREGRCEKNEERPINNLLFKILSWIQRLVSLTPSIYQGNDVD